MGVRLPGRVFDELAHSSWILSEMESQGTRTAGDQMNGLWEKGGRLPEYTHTGNTPVHPYRQYQSTPGGLEYTQLIYQHT